MDVQFQANLILFHYAIVYVMKRLDRAARHGAWICWGEDGGGTK